MGFQIPSAGMKISPDLAVNKTFTDRSSKDRMKKTERRSEDIPHMLHRLGFYFPVQTRFGVRKLWLPSFDFPCNQFIAIRCIALTEIPIQNNENQLALTKGSMQNTRGETASEM